MKTNLLLFIAGDNNLDTFGETDIEELMSVKDTGENLTILVQYDQSSLARDSSTKRFVIRQGVKEKTLHIGETNTGDSNTLTEFLRWGIETYKADRNIVILWNHGGGTRDELISGYENAERVLSKSVIPSKSINPTLGNQNSFFSQSLRIKRVQELMNSFQEKQGEKISFGEIEAKSILLDDDSRDFLDNLELKKVFDDLNKKVDIIGFDACLMSMLEVAYQLKNHAELLVGSEELEPGNGWDYRAIVRFLVAHPTASNEEVAKAIVESFMLSYAEDEKLKVTLSALHTDKFDQVACRLDEFAYTVLRKEQYIRGSFWDIVEKTQTFDYQNREEIYRDLKHFVSLTQEHYAEDLDINRASKNLLKALDEMIFMSKSRNLENAHGLSVYLPTNPNMSAFALDVFSALDINAEASAPSWFQLFKQIGNIDKEENYLFGAEAQSSCPDEDLMREEIMLEEKFPEEEFLEGSFIEEVISEDVREENIEEESHSDFPTIDSSKNFTDLIAVPKNINEGLHGTVNSLMRPLLGSVKCVNGDTLGDVAKRFILRTKPANFKTNANGFDLAVESLKEVLAEIAEVYPTLLDKIDTVGMKNCRCISSSCSALSNHSWGTAIDLTIDGKLDHRGNNKVQYGLTLIAPIFNKHGWFWGAGFRIEDAMHFEISREKLLEWHNDGKLLGNALQVKPDVSLLRLGDRSQEVLLLQKRLNHLGYILIEDGIFGAGTHLAVLDFQEKYGLKMDGVVGSKTMKILEGLVITSKSIVSKSIDYPLSLGMRSRAVQIAQERLNGYGFELLENGYFDKVMLSVVLDYQRAYGLEETGIVDEATGRNLSHPTKRELSIRRTYPLSVLGDQNEEVFNLQALLKNQGYSLAVTGLFGLEMEKIVKEIQEKNALSMTGHIDSLTRKLITKEK